MNITDFIYADVDINKLQQTLFFEIGDDLPGEEIVVESTSTTHYIEYCISNGIYYTIDTFSKNEKDYLNVYIQCHINLYDENDKQIGSSTILKADIKKPLEAFKLEILAAIHAQFTLLGIDL